MSPTYTSIMRLYADAQRQAEDQPNHPFRPQLERVMFNLRAMYPEVFTDACNVTLDLRDVRGRSSTVPHTSVPSPRVCGV